MSRNTKPKYQIPISSVQESYFLPNLICKLITLVNPYCLCPFVISFYIAMYPPHVKLSLYPAVIISNLCNTQNIKTKPKVAAVLVVGHIWMILSSFKINLSLSLSQFIQAHNVVKTSTRLLLVFAPEHTWMILSLFYS